MRATFRRPGSAVWRSSFVLSHAPGSHSQKRLESTLVSTTAINATKTIPPRNRHLHEALNNLKRKAAGQVDLSRLQLAIQGLESEQPTTRIALLGANGPATARLLARILLTDSSKPHQEWEAQLAAQDGQQEQALVIRYGDLANVAFEAPRSALPVLLVPSLLLQSQKVEMVISSINTPSPNSLSRGLVSIPSNALLSPTVGTPIAADGRQSLISQPVHRSVLVTSRSDELLGFGKLLSATMFGSEAERRLVDVVVDLSGRIESSESQIIGVDATKAEDSLRAVREAISRAPEHQQMWMESGMMAFSELVLGPPATSTSNLSRPVRELITSLLEAASVTLASQEREAAAIARSNALTHASRSSLHNAISIFSQQGHAELQSGLAAAWSSRNWRKLAFWKLFWRVDDVPLIVSDLVTTAWLPRADRAVYELSGRLKQAGVPIAVHHDQVVAPRSQVSAVSSTENSSPALSDSTQPLFALASRVPAEHPSMPTTSPARTTAAPDPSPYTPPPIVSTISAARQTIIASSISTLASSAQQIVLRSLTITAVSATLSALSFLSITSGSIYESTTVLALGTAYALRRMQQEWHTQRAYLEQDLMDEGRSALKWTEHRMRSLVEDAARVLQDEVEVNMRREAVEAVERAKAALTELK